MATGDKLFLATQSDVQEVGSKVDIVDTTTKDTNSKVASLTSKSDEINTTVTNNNTLIQDVKTNTLSVGVKVDNVSTNVDTVISKLDNVGSSKWYYSGKTGATKHLFKASDAEFQPMGAMNDTTIRMKGYSTIDNNPIYVLGSFIPKISGWHRISFAWQGASVYPVNLAIGSLQDFYLASISEIFFVSSDTSSGMLDVGEAISNMLQGKIENARITSCVNVALQRMPYVTLGDFTGANTYLYCNLVKDVPVYYWAVNTGKGNITNFQIYNVSCIYNENEALY